MIVDARGPHEVVTVDGLQVAFLGLGQGRWMAIDLTEGEEQAQSATGGNKRDALANLKLRLAGKTPVNETPSLQLCRACNKRAAELGDQRCSIEGVEVCAKCAQAIDTWQTEIAAWRRRQRAKKLKAKRRANRQR